MQQQQGFYPLFKGYNLQFYNLHFKIISINFLEMLQFQNVNNLNQLYAFRHDKKILPMERFRQIENPSLNRLPYTH